MLEGFRVPFKEGIHVLYKAKMGLFMLRIIGVPMYCMLYEMYASSDLWHVKSSIIG